MDRIAEQTISIVRAAGEMVCSQFKQTKKILHKGQANYVTQIDFAVQDFLVEKLQEIVPESSFITEENAKDIHKLAAQTWIIDPVDGTTNLIHNYPHIAISTAFYQDGTPILGVVYNPLTREMFHAVAGKGAYLNGEPINVSPNKKLVNCIVGFGLPYNRLKAHIMFEAVESLFYQCQDLRRTGSAALDLAYVACGRIDGYFELSLAPWDYAAGYLLVKEAGGKITGWDNKRVQVPQSADLVASNKAIHHSLIEILRKSDSLRPLTTAVK